MSVNSLPETLDLMRRVLALERKKGYRNTSATGGVLRYFQDQFGKSAYDVDTWSFVEGLLSGLKRYESMRTEAERHAQAEILVRCIEEYLSGAPVNAAQAVPIGPVSAAHRGDAEAVARRRAPVGSARAGADRARADGPAPALVAEASPTPVEAMRQESPAQDSSDGTDGATPVRQAGVPLAAKRAITGLDQPLADALGIRSREAEHLSRLGIRTVEDALYHLPRDHYDCRNPLPIHKLRPGMTTTVIGTLQSVGVRKTARNHTLVEARIADATAVVRVSWFSQFMAPLLRARIGQRIAVSGRTDLAGGRLRFVPRDYEFPDDDDLTHTGRLVPIYPLTEGLTQRWVRGTIKKALDAGLDLLREPLPEWLLDEYNLMVVRDALRGYHFPADEQEKTHAVRRLAFDELLYISIGMMRRKRAWQVGQTARPVPRDAALEERFAQALPFDLTRAQRRAADEILSEMASTTPMRRLLQGDVGSGKTVVAAAALLMAARAGLQGAIMAPTEILAEQHARTITPLLAPFDVPVALLTGSVTGAERRRIYDAVAAGEIAVLAGTHALIQDEVAFNALGLVVVDEQHRFGVEQRALLRRKGVNPHVLAMTATPIPRSLQLTIYGDLDISVIDERPPGRQPVLTTWEPLESRAFDLIHQQTALGRQAFVICPLVEADADEQDSDQSSASGRREARAAVAEQKRLQREVFPDLSVGLLHGQMKPADKEKTLARFRDGEIAVLVATSVVEVGIDVPNATVMVIQQANRFGLAQLHQLRGRVGRSGDRAYCVLLSDGASAAGQQRLNAITSTDDGFELAARDLELRGPGEFLGTRQSGLPTLRVAGMGDARIIEDARKAAEHVMERDPDLSSPDHHALAVQVERFWNRDSERS